MVVGITSKSGISINHHTTSSEHQETPFFAVYPSSSAASPSPQMPRGIQNEPTFTMYTNQYLPFSSDAGAAVAVADGGQLQLSHKRKNEQTSTIQCHHMCGGVHNDCEQEMENDNDNDSTNVNLMIGATKIIGAETKNNPETICHKMGNTTINDLLHQVDLEKEKSDQVLPSMTEKLNGVPLRPRRESLLNATAATIMMQTKTKDALDKNENKLTTTSQNLLSPIVILPTSITDEDVLVLDESTEEDEDDNKHDDIDHKQKRKSVDNKNLQKAAALIESNLVSLVDSSQMNQDHPQRKIRATVDNLMPITMSEDRTTQEGVCLNTFQDRPCYWKNETTTGNDKQIPHNVSGEDSRDCKYPKKEIQADAPVAAPTKIMRQPTRRRKKRVDKQTTVKDLIKMAIQTKKFLAFRTAPSKQSGQGSWNHVTAAKREKKRKKKSRMEENALTAPASKHSERLLREILDSKNRPTTTTNGSLNKHQRLFYLEILNEHRKKQRFQVSNGTQHQQRKSRRFQEGGSHHLPPISRFYSKSDKWKNKRIVDMFSSCSAEDLLDFELEVKDISAEESAAQQCCESPCLSQWNEVIDDELVEEAAELLAGID